MNASGRFDVLGLGNAIVDVIAYTEDGPLDALGLEKGAMTLIDAARSEELYDCMGPAQETSGGSCANTMAALAALGGRGAYIGRVRDDQLGAVFSHDIRAAGVTFRSTPSRTGPATARCLVFVTPDAQRTMQTYLGACVELGPEDVDEGLVRQSDIVYLEGYLWDRPEAKAACLKAAEIAHAAGNRVALTLSDSFCVERWHGEFRSLLRERIDILFANEAEILRLYETQRFDEAARQAREDVGIAVLTQSAKGALVLQGEAAVAIAAQPVERLLDTTGAGDLFAAGFFRGLAGGMDLSEAGRLGALAAAQILGQYGARAERPLLPLLERLQAAA